MFDGGHSRSSYPFDKRVPKMPKLEKVLSEDGDFIYSYGYTSIGRQVVKDMHKKKQHQHDSFLEKNWDLQ